MNNSTNWGADGNMIFISKSSTAGNGAGVRHDILWRQLEVIHESSFSVLISSREARKVNTWSEITSSIRLKKYRCWMRGLLCNSMRRSWEEILGPGAASVSVVNRGHLVGTTASMEGSRLAPRRASSSSEGTRYGRNRGHSFGLQVLVSIDRYRKCGNASPSNRGRKV